MAVLRYRARLASRALQKHLSKGVSRFPGCGAHRCGPVSFQRHNHSTTRCAGAEIAAVSLPRPAVTFRQRLRPSVCALPASNGAQR